MTPRKLTPEQAQLSKAKQKEYQKEYHAWLDIDIKRKYMHARNPEKLKIAQKNYRMKKLLLSKKNQNESVSKKRN